MIKNKIFISTTGFISSNLLKGLAECRKEGLSSIELGGADNFNPKIKSLILQLYKKHGFHFLVHNYFPPSPHPFVLNLGSEDPEILKKSIHFCSRSIDLCEEFGSPFYSVHSGFAVDPKPEQLGKRLLNLPRHNLKKIYRNMVESLTGLAEYGKAKGVKVLLENHVLSWENLQNGFNILLTMCSPEDFRCFINDFSKSEVGILLDVGHLNVSANVLGFDKFKAIEIIADRVEAFHLHDNDANRDQHLPFSKNSWFTEILPAYREQAVFIIEVCKRPIAELKKQVNLLAHILKDS